MTLASLPVFLKLAGEPVIVVGNGEGAAAKRRLIERAGGNVVGETGEARIAIVALENDLEAHAAVERLRARGVLINAVDRPELCDFTTPAIVDRDPVLIALGTGGVSAGLAKALRQRFEAILPADLGEIARWLSKNRTTIRDKWPNASDRRRAIDVALSEFGPLDSLRPFDEPAAIRWLDNGIVQDRNALLSYTLRSGDPDDLTLAQARALGQADVVVHSPDVAPAILARARADAVRLAQTALPLPLPAGFVVQLRMLIA